MSTFHNRAAAGLVLATVALSAATVHAAPVTTQATVKARVLKQITVTKTADLDFGTIVAGTAASTVGVSTASSRTCGSGLTCTGTASSANFNISGTNNAVVTITGDNSVTLANGSGGTMTAALTRSASTITLANSGAVGGSFQVGGTLNIAANQADGNYTGTFNVTVDYQ
jgi:spore coat protein U-like protein